MITEYTAKDYRKNAKVQGTMETARGQYAV